MKIGVVAPASRLEPATAARVSALASSVYAQRAEIIFHPQCFLSSGHFAGDDDVRAKAFLEFANDEGFSALWFARGGYGSGRIAGNVLGGLSAAAKKKIYFGYSDGAFLLAAPRMPTDATNASKPPRRTACGCTVLPHPDSLEASKDQFRFPLLFRRALEIQGIWNARRITL